MSSPRRENRRARRPRRRASALDVHFDQAFGRIVRVAASAGYTPKQIQAKVKEKCRKLPRSWARKEKEPVPAMDAASDVLDLWFSDARHLDSNGNPRPLPLRGRTASLESLSLQVAPELDVEEVLRHLLRPSVVRQTEAGYVPRDRVLWFRGSGSPYHARSLRILSAMAGTLDHNRRPERSTPGWMELRAVHQHVPTRQLPALDQRVRQSGKTFLIDTLEEFKKADRETSPAEPRKLVGLGIYWFEEPPLLPERTERPVRRAVRRPRRRAK